MYRHNNELTGSHIVSIDKIVMKENAKVCVQIK